MRLATLFIALGSTVGVAVAQSPAGFVLDGPVVVSPRHSTIVCDVDDDGLRDLAIGVPDDSVGGIGAGALCVASSKTGSILWMTQGSGPATPSIVTAGQALGAAVATLDDLDGDGTQDIIASSPNASTPFAYAGRLEARSGLDGAVLWSVAGALPNERLGRSACVVADWNGDGVRDVMHGGSDAFPGTYQPRRYVAVRSGVDGSLVQRFDAASPSQTGYGESFVDAGDLDADGAPDVLIVDAPLAGSTQPSSVEARSGLTGAHLHVAVGADPWQSFGAAVVVVGDIDGDGTPDYAVGAPRAVTAPVVPNTFDLLSFRSGASGGEVYSIQHVGGAGFASALAACGDADGDGVDEIAIGIPRDGSGGFSAGALLHFDPAQQLALGSITGSPGQELGRTVNSGGDVNGDGFGDVLVGRLDPASGQGQTVLHYFGPLTGSIGAGAADLLSLDGDDGGVARTLHRALLSPFVLLFDSPTASPTPFILWGALGRPSDFSPLHFGFGSLLFVPQPFVPWDARLFTFVDSIFVGDPFALLPAQPAPFALGFPLGLPFPAEVVVQGLAIQGNGALAPTNALFIRVD